MDSSRMNLVVVSALQLAADQYREDAKNCRRQINDAGQLPEEFGRVAAAFDRQAHEADAVLDRLINGHELRWAGPGPAD